MATDGVVREGVVTPGTVADGVVTGGVVTEGIVTDGTMMVGTVTVGTVIEGTVIEGTVMEGMLTKDTVSWPVAGAGAAKSGTEIANAPPSSKRNVISDKPISPVRSKPFAASASWSILRWRSLQTSRDD